MENIIVIAILALIVGAAALYVYKAKKSGKRCIGCGDCAHCSASCGAKSHDTDGNEKK